VPTPSRGPFSFYCTSQHNCREREELNIKLKPKWSIVKAMDIKPQEQVFQLWSGERDALESDSTYPDGTVPFKDTVYLLNTAQTKLDNLGSVSVVDLPLGSRKNDIISTVLRRSNALVHLIKQIIPRLPEDVVSTDMENWLKSQSTEQS
jgi:hypothetical protein